MRTSFSDRYPKSLRPGIDTAVRKHAHFVSMSVGGEKQRPVEAFKASGPFTPPGYSMLSESNPCSLTPLILSPALLSSFHQQHTKPQPTPVVSIHPPHPPPSLPSSAVTSVRRRAPRWRKYRRVLVVSSNPLSLPTSPSYTRPPVSHDFITACASLRVSHDLTSHRATCV